MTKRIDTQARIEAVRLQDQGSNPAAPAAGYTLMYTKAGSLYLETSSEVVGPLLTGTASAVGTPVNGWVSDTNSWSYLSADSPSFVASVNANVTGTMSVGMKIKLTQTSEKFFFLTSISVTGSTSYLNLYGGTDYTLADAAITSPYYSTSRAPFGFPLDPTKWTQSTSNTNLIQMNSNSPAQNTWYNSISLSIPIGQWVVFYSVVFQAGRANSATSDMKHTLSTANNSESSNVNTSYQYDYTGQGLIGTFTKRIDLTLAAKATYYLNHLTTQTSANVFQTRGDISPTLISAVCAYL